MTTTYKRIDGELLASELSETEIVMLNVTKSEYYGCEGVAKTIWDAIEAPMTIDQIISTVTATYPDAPAEVANEVQEFLDQLHESALVHRAEP